VVAGGEARQRSSRPVGPTPSLPGASGENLPQHLPWERGHRRAHERYKLYYCVVHGIYRPTISVWVGSREAPGTGPGVSAGDGLAVLDLVDGVVGMWRERKLRREMAIIGTSIRPQMGLAGMSNGSTCVLPGCDAARRIDGFLDSTARVWRSGR